MQSITIGNIKSERKSDSQYVPLSFYLDPPSDEITLDEFEMLSLDRLQLLRAVEYYKSKIQDENELNNKISQAQKKFLFDKNAIYSKFNNEKRDYLSHFTLKLGYCSSEDLRRWFITQECILFKFRLEMMTEEEREQFMFKNGVCYEQVTEEEKRKKNDFLCGLSGITNISILKTKFYKVPFQQALPLIASRSVYLEGGFAYVPLPRLVSTILATYRSKLSKSLAEAFNIFIPRIMPDERIYEFVKSISQQYIGDDFTQKSHQSMDKLTPERVDQAADLDMPLCMKNLHLGLKKEHKLKHWGRLQYGLFLKGAGMELDDALKFWENNFTRGMTQDQFVKQYAYNFRHMYGKEGARKNYTPYSCMKIIMGNPPEPGGYHGCPYRHMGDGQLAALLTSLKIGMTETKDIVNLAKTSNYQLACQKHFEITHPGYLQMEELRNSEVVSTHPNLWFRVSMEYHKIKSGQNNATATPGSSQTTNKLSIGSSPAAASSSSAGSSQIQSQSQA